jgi:hypothetical protein
VPIATPLDVAADGEMQPGLRTTFLRPEAPPASSSRSAIVLVFVVLAVIAAVAAAIYVAFFAKVHALR